MAMGPDTDIDVLLIAYLDDALEPELRREVERRLDADDSLRERLAAFAESGEELRNAFDGLLETAPRARLEAGLASALATAPRRRDDRYRNAILAAAASLLLLIGGGVVGYFVANAPGDLFEEADAFEDEWIAAVAGQLQLYNADSVAAIEVNDSEQQAALTKLGEMLKLDLSPSKVAFEGLTLKRAELLHFQGQKIAELLYASERHGPIALCIMVRPGGEGEGEVESKEGLNLMYWASGGRRFLLIGAAPEERIEEIADAVNERFRS
jgi:anti-sigma factor RsiW